MRRLGLTIVVLAVFGASAARADPADPPPKHHGKGASKDQKKDESGPWTVIKVGDEMRVLQKDAIPDLQKRLDAEHEKAAKAAADKKDPKAQKPTPRKVEVLKGGFAKARDAEIWIEKRKQELEAQEKARNAPSWSVIQVGGELRVVARDQVDVIKKQIEKENEKSAKAAAKDKKPAPIAFSVVKGGFSRTAEAEKYLEQHKGELQAKALAEKEKQAKLEKEKHRVPDDDVDL